MDEYTQHIRKYRQLQNDHDACGIGAVVNIDGHQDNRVLDDALAIVEKLEHRAGKLRRPRGSC